MPPDDRRIDHWPGHRDPETVFLDRDGTIIEDRGYLTEPEGVALLPGAAEGLRGLSRLGLRLVVLTNQSGVARGYLSLPQLDAVHARLETLLRAEGVALAGIFTCPHAPGPCDCRKPAPGLAHQAAAHLDIDLGASIVVGDKESDVGLAHALGVPAVLVRTGEGQKTRNTSETAADLVVDDLAELARILGQRAGLTRVRGAEPAGDDNVSADTRVTEEQVRRHVEESAAVTRQAAAECAGPIAAAAVLISHSLRTGGKLLLCGNGGSAADCQHLAAEFVHVLDRGRKRPALAAIALTTDTSLLTAVANDIGFEHVFARQIEALGRSTDVLLAISTGGNSPNVVEALSRARGLGMATILLTGSAGGRAEAHVDVLVSVPSTDTQHIQEAHIALGHALVAAVELSIVELSIGDRR